MSSFASLRIGVMALQGAFAEHVQMIRDCGAQAEEIRKPLSDNKYAGLDAFDGIILPGGESTVIGKLLVEWNLMEGLKARIAEGMPVYGSCAGLILLSKDIEGPDGAVLDQPRIGMLDATARRNAFGRQIDSFEIPLEVEGIADSTETPLPAVFIRAPIITRTGADVQVLASVEKSENSHAPAGPVAVRQGNILATSFHPELTTDTRLHKLFLEMAEAYKAAH